jgi:hypothetical protein
LTKGDLKIEAFRRNISLPDDLMPAGAIQRNRMGLINVNLIEIRRFE